MSASKERSISEEPSIKSLASQVMQLASIVKQNTRLTIQHGEDIMRIDASRMGIDSRTGSELPLSNSSIAHPSAMGPGNDDSGVIQELVGELQVKLDELEERSVRRSQNVHAREAEDEIVWLPNPLGPDHPDPSTHPPPTATSPRDTAAAAAGAGDDRDDDDDDETQAEQDVPEFPRTVAAFEAIDAVALLKCMKFYGLVHYEQGMPLPSATEFRDLFNECAKFLGLRSRKK